MAFISQHDQNDEARNLEILEEKGDEKFLDLVKARPWLYDKKHQSYSDKLMIHNAWKDISAVLNDSIENCESRWARLKRNYNAEQMAQLKESKSGSGKSTRRPWCLYDKMKSLYDNTNYQNRKTYSNLPSTSYENNIQPSKNCYSEKKLWRKPKKQSNVIDQAFANVNSTVDSVVQFLQNSSVEESVQINNDPDKLFGLLVSAELKTFDINTATKKYKKIMRYLSDFD